MATEVRKIDLDNLSEVIRIMNESSQGMSFEWHLDLFSFLALFRYWNFSHEHSLISYVDGEAAAMVLNCVDPQTREAYTVYWGALPKFRSGRLSLSLFNQCCKKLRDDGYTVLHGVTVPDRPASRYRFISAEAAHALVDMEAQSPVLPEPDSQISVREVTLDQLTQLRFPANEFVHWSQRHSFLRHSERFFQFIGAYAEGELTAYAVSLPNATKTSLADIRSRDANLAPGYELLRFLVQAKYRPPLTVSNVPEDSYAHRLLTAAGFSVTRQISTLFRNLQAA